MNLYTYAPEHGEPENGKVAIGLDFESRIIEYLTPDQAREFAAQLINAAQYAEEVS
jgi:hypothetical protein